VVIVYFSYQQTIGAYPTGGGSYTVARRNLGVFPGLLGAAALLLDYVLVVAVGISAGVGALVSAVPALQPYTLTLCLTILALIATVNLRGVRDSGVAFILPTYLFVACLFAVIAIGLVKTWLSGGQPVPVDVPPALPAATATATVWLLLRAFASGCTAMTGVEAVSNGVSAFREPAVKHARTTLTVHLGRRAGREVRGGRVGDDAAHPAAAHDVRRCAAALSRRRDRDCQSAAAERRQHPAAHRDHPDEPVEQDVSEGAAIRPEAVA
jgi:amino acid transporter